MNENNIMGDTIRYLDNNFLTIHQLAVKTGIDMEQLEKLINYSCIPSHSHKITRQCVFHTDVFGDAIIEEMNILYYHPSLVKWAQKANNYLQSVDISSVAERMKTDFINELRDSLTEIDSAAEIFNDCFVNGKLTDDGVRKIMDAHWPYIMNGTYGVCLKEISAKNVVIKNIAVSILENWIKGSEDCRNMLYQKARQAAAWFDTVAAEFGPHDLEKSTRGRLYNKFIEYASG